ncbi:MAG: tetratricopeptide repeat protein [Breznakibacter sp.]
MTRLKSYLKPTLTTLFLICLLFGALANARDQKLLKIKEALSSPIDTVVLNAATDLAWEYANNHTDTAMFYAQKALKLAEKTNWANGFIKAYGAMEVIYAMQGQFKESVECGIKGYEILLKINRTDKLAPALSNIGLGYMQMHDFDKALFYFQKAIDEARKLNNTNVQISAYTSAYESLVRLGKYPLAEQYAQQAKALCVQQADTSRWARLLSVQGEMEALRNNLVESNDYLLESLKLRKPQDQYGRSKCLVLITNNYIKLKHPDLAHIYLVQADSLVSRNKNFSQKVNVANLWTAYYELKGDYRNALRQHQTFKNLSDSLHATDKEKYVSSLQTKFDSQQKELELQKIKAEVTDEKIKRRTFLVVSLVLGTAVIVSVVQVRRRNRRLERENLIAREKVEIEQEKLKNMEERNLLQQQREELVRQQAELEKQKLEEELAMLESQQSHLSSTIDENHRSLLATSMQREQHMEFLSQMQAQLNELKNLPGKKEWEPAVNQLISAVKSRISQEDDWDKIKLYFEKVHPQFFETLKARHPDLSVNELKMCAYTKINMNGKEISRLLNINPNSVQVARYRLKRKMNLSESVNFSDYVIQNF